MASIDSPWSRRRKLTLADLIDEPWLMPETDNIAMSLIEEAFSSAGLTPPAPQVVSNSITLRVRLIETGRFVGMMPESALRFGAGRMRIKILPVRLPMETPPTVAISLKNRTPNPIAKLFIGEVRAFARASMKTKAS